MEYADEMAQNKKTAKKDLRLELLKELSNLSGVPGQEDAVRDFVLAQLEGLVDEVHVDALGNVIALRAAEGTVNDTDENDTSKKAGKKGGKKKKAHQEEPIERVMVCAHMDEIGFIVRHIDEQGFLYIQPLGGFDARNLFARTVTVHAMAGPMTGILSAGGSPVHVATPEERNKIPAVKDFVVDLGFPADFVRTQVNHGDMITLNQTAQEVGHLICGKALDDRVCVFMLLELLQRFKKKRPKHDLYAVFSVQEEVGLRGATTAAYSIEPTIGIALDVTLAVDTPNVSSSEAVTRIGDGIGVKVFDASMISTRWLVHKFEELSCIHNIPTQLEVLPFGGTDGGAIQRSGAGVPTITLSVPTRYIHTIVEAVHPTDIKSGVDLLTAYFS